MRVCKLVHKHIEEATKNQARARQTGVICRLFLI